MAARRAVLHLLPFSRRALTGACGAALAVGLGLSSCYSAGSGQAPPTNNLYYPEGLAVSTSTTRADGSPEDPGDVLYVANSDFDLQYNGGTLQSYNLTQIRQDTAALISWNLTGALPSGDDAGLPPFIFGTVSCLGESITDPSMRSNGQRTPLGQACAPPVDSTQPRYFEDSAVIGAFATDLQLSRDGKRLLAPVSGDATLTWANVDGANFDCAQDQNGGRCGGQFLVGNVVDAQDTRGITMPGDPFGMAQTQDGTAIAITHQATQETSLLLSGLQEPGSAVAETTPSMQFVLEGVPNGGTGIVAVPHDPDAVVRCEDVNDTYPCVRQAFLESSRSAGQIDLLRYYDDEGSGLHNAQNPSLRRPFLELEQNFAITVNSPGTDQRSIVIDDSPSLKCKVQEALATGAGPGSPAYQECGQQYPSRVFIGSRSPASIIYGTMGGPSSNGDGTYDPDLLTMLASVPLDPNTGVSRLFLAPVVDAWGHYSLRLFVVCYDASTIVVFDPERIAAREANAIAETVISTGTGPFAMAFDPSCTGLVDSSGNPMQNPLGPLACSSYGPLADVAVSEVAELNGDLSHFLVPVDPKPNGAAFGLRTYRFGYLATFTDSYLQVIDLDDSLSPPPSPTSAGAPARSQETYESVVFTFGNPTPPKGT
jgi:hypothetical protein